MAVGVIIARLQPIHKGHLELVRQALVERDFVSFKLNARGAIHNSLSATKVRQMILKGDEEALVEAVPTCVVENAMILKHFIEAFQDV